MMRILALTNLFPSPWLPNRATFNRQQLAALGRQHPLHVIAPVSWTDRLRSRNPSARKVVAPGDFLVEHPQFIFTPGFFRRHHGSFYIRSVRHTFDRAVQQFKPDVVLAAWAYPDAFAAATLCQEANLPWVAKVHGSDVLLLKENSLRKQQTVNALRAADAVIAVSGHLATAVRSLGVPSNRVHTVYNGIDTALFHADEKNPSRGPADPATILFVGNLVAIKGIDTLIDACALLLRRNLQFRCDIIGTGPLRSRLLRRIRSAGLHQQIHLLGARPLSELPHAYRAADLLVLPSRSEGVPNVILEAIACGTPVLATRVGGIPEVVDEQSLVEPNDPSALAEGILTQLTMPSRSEFQPQSWQQSATDLAAVLDHAIQRNRKAAA